MSGEAATTLELLTRAGEVIALIFLFITLVSGVVLVSRALAHALGRLFVGVTGIFNSFLDVSRASAEQIAISNQQLEILRKRHETSDDLTEKNTLVLQTLETAVKLAPTTISDKLSPALKRVIDDVSVLADQIGQVRQLIQVRADAHDAALRQIDNATARLANMLPGLQTALIEAVRASAMSPASAPAATVGTTLVGTSVLVAVEDPAKVAETQK